MAQRKTGRRRLQDLARRYGITARRGTLLGLGVFMLVLAVAGSLFCVSQGGFALVRTSHTQLGDMSQEEGRVSDALGDEESHDDSGGTQADGVVLDRTTAANQAPAGFVVHVDGAVANPGVYRLEGLDLRLVDAVDRAGGLLPDADTSTINLAAPLVDGAKIHVPREGDVMSGSEQAVSIPGSQESSLVNLNTATSEELQSLSGIGEVTAQAIIDEREANGPYVSVEDVMRVSGIGEKKFERIKDHVCV